MSKLKRETVELSDGREVVLTLIPLKAYAEMLGLFAAIFKEVLEVYDGDQDIDDTQLLEMVPEFVTNHLPEAAEFIQVASAGQVTKQDALEVYGLADAIDIISAAIIVNDINRIVGSVKKVMATTSKVRAKVQPPAGQKAPTN